VLPAPNLHRKFNTHWRKWCCRFLYKSLRHCEKEREKVLARPLKQFFPPERAAKKYICVRCKSFCFLSSKLFSTQSGNKFPCSGGGGASVISTGALVERHTVALFERLSRQSECFWASGTLKYKRSPCKFQTRARAGRINHAAIFQPTPFKWKSVEIAFPYSLIPLSVMLWKCFMASSCLQLQTKSFFVAPHGSKINYPAARLEAARRERRCNKLRGKINCWLQCILRLCARASISLSDHQLPINLGLVSWPTLYDRRHLQPKFPDPGSNLLSTLLQWSIESLVWMPAKIACS
jgi:hypothetical protein